MRTAYDGLRKAVVKDFGWWYRKEWNTLPEDVRERIADGVAYSHFSHPFLTSLYDLYIDRSRDVGVIRGKQTNGVFIEEEYEENLIVLRIPFVYHWCVFSSVTFGDWFELKGFRSKSAAIDFYKEQKKREDDLFYCFMYRW